MQIHTVHFIFELEEKHSRECKPQLRSLIGGGVLGENFWWTLAPGRSSLSEKKE